MQQDIPNNINTLGSRLSLVLSCPITLSGYGKEAFVCYHGVNISIARLEKSSDWSWAKKEHDKEVGNECDTTAKELH